jgi:haloacetate dehalogenase
LLAQPEPLPERLFASDPAAFVDAALEGWGSKREAFPEELRRLYVEALANPATAHAICEEYRAAATLDEPFGRSERLVVLSEFQVPLSSSDRSETADRTERRARL